ncbi:MAG TPA: hypothetical protein VK196_09065 [Magnetospirillum sp.]|nr:hypothetical protein [Magnetospirillum sp.]
MKKLTLAVAVLAVSTGLSACQTGKPVALAEAPSALTGEWNGTLTDGRVQNGRYVIQANAGVVTGKAYLPSSRVKTEQTFTGIYDGSTVKFKTDADWAYELTLSKQDNGTYSLSGMARGGTSAATVELNK